MAKTIDETGNVYGQLTVLRRVGYTSTGKATWWCRCSCGQEKEIVGSHLRSGHTKTCGCSGNRESMNLIDEVGNVYSKLTVIERAANTKEGQAQWLCRCECGNNSIVCGKSLRQGKTKSCGCLKHDSALSNGVAARNRLECTYRWNAEHRGLECHLLSGEFQQLTSSNCHYCGTEPKQKAIPSGDSGIYYYNGIDRVDNSKGYTLDNVVPCCGLCNRGKMDMDNEVFMQWIAKVYHNHAYAIISI